SADGAHMAETRAGSGTGSVQNAAGPLDNAKCHIYRKDSTVAKTKATGPGYDMSMPEDMDGIQIWNSSGSSLQGRVMACGYCRPTVSCGS
ncbi:hypothetical protein M9458_038022, partial [Cirrhinus mrigala]